MSIHETGGTPDRPEDTPTDDVRDGGTRALPDGAEPSGVESLWGLGTSDTAPSPATPEPAPAAPSSAWTSATEAASSTAGPAPRKGRRAVRVGTVVWGLVVVACGVLVLAAARGASIDGGTVAIAILGGAGVALVLGSIVTGVRRRDRA